MTRWTINARPANKPQDKGLIAVDLIFDGGVPKTLRFGDIKLMIDALDNALSGTAVDFEDRPFQCIPVGGEFTLFGFPLSVEEAERLRCDLKEIIAP